MTDNREFPLADVLSVTTPYLLSRRRMDGVCGLVDWMVPGTPTPQMLDLHSWGQLKMRTRVAHSSILRQHPELGRLQPPHGLDEPDLYAWLVHAEAEHGETVALDRATEEIQEILRVFTEGMRKAGEAFSQFNRDLSATMVGIGADIRKLFETVAQDERRRIEAMAAHPDIVALGDVDGDTRK